MSDGTDTLDQNAPETASEEVENNSLPTDSAPSDLGQDEGGEEAASPEDELDELEWDGEKYSIPKKLKPGFMMQSDYTRKTQEVAEERKTLAAEKASLAEQVERVKALSEDRKQLIRVDDFLERQSKVNWQQFFRDDPLEAPAKWAEYQHWQQQRQGIVAKVEENEAALSEAAQSEKTKRLTETFKAVATQIPGWNGDLAKKLESFATTSGMTVKQLDKGIEKVGASFVKMLHKAYLADQILQSKQQAAKVSSVPQEPVKPLAVVSKGKAPAARAGLHDDLDSEEWAKRRREQLRNRK